VVSGAGAIEQQQQHEVRPLAHEAKPTAKPHTATKPNNRPIIGRRYQGMAPCDSDVVTGVRVDGQGLVPCVPRRVDWNRRPTPARLTPSSPKNLP
jgi:hypothetical protein